MRVASQITLSPLAASFVTVRRLFQQPARSSTGSHSLSLVVMDLELKPPLPAPGVPGWAKEEAFQGRRLLVRGGKVEADGTETGIILGEPQPQVSALENLQALNAEVFAAEDRLRVPFAEGPQELQAGH